MNKEYLKQLLEDYAYDPDIMNDEPEEVTRIKYAISRLDESDKIIFLLQTDLHSQRKVGEMLGVSHSTVGKVYNNIKNKVIEYMKEYDN